VFDVTQSSLGFAGRRPRFPANRLRLKHKHLIVSTPATLEKARYRGVRRGGDMHGPERFDWTIA
jgi:hypothetical protein